jgi:sugar lactone lactonase YvrE
VKNSKGLVLVASTKKIIAIISLTLLLIPVSNVFAFSNGQAATVAVGQGSFTTGTIALSASGLFAPRSSTFDSFGNLWVADQSNNRILKYAAPITTGEAASVVLGQGTTCPACFTTGTANNGGISASSLNQPFDLAFDSTGNLWVTDTFNNRILEYAGPANSITTGEAATVVLGQGTTCPACFTTGTANNGGISAISLHFPDAISFDSTGNLWVTDASNSRVLEYAAPITTGEAATTVIGQALFTTNSFGTTATTLKTPIGITFDPVGNLWVSDNDNNRVTKYLAPITTGEAATVVLGQGTTCPACFTTGTANNGGISASSLFVPYSITSDSVGNLWVADYSNNRVLKYAAPITTGDAATTVLGQGASFTTGISNNGGISASSLSNPSGVTIESGGNLWIVDGSNHRVLKFPVTVSQVTGQVTLIAGTCGINIVSGAPINYGSLIAGSVSTEQTVVLQNTGTVPGTLAVHGTDWLDGSSTSQMLVGSTKFSATTGTYLSKTALTTGDLPVGTILPTPNLSTFWQVQATPISPTFGGTLTQTVTFSNSC